MYRDFAMPSLGQKVNNATNDMFLKRVLFGLCFKAQKVTSTPETGIL